MPSRKRFWLEWANLFWTTLRQRLFVLFSSWKTITKPFSVPQEALQLKDTFLGASKSQLWETLKGTSTVKICIVAIRNRNSYENKNKDPAFWVSKPQCSWSHKRLEIQLEKRQQRSLVASPPPPPLQRETCVVVKSLEAGCLGWDLDPPWTSCSF